MPDLGSSSYTSIARASQTCDEALLKQTVCVCVFIVFFFSLSILSYFYSVLLFDCLFPKRERKKVELCGWVGGENLEGHRGGESIIRIKHVKILFSNNKNHKKEM